MAADGALCQHEDLLSTAWSCSTPRNARALAELIASDIARLARDRGAARTSWI